MIHFACPNCRTAYQADDARAGEKFNCQPCGQRMEIPHPSTNRTVLAPLTPPSVLPPVAIVVQQQPAQQVPAVNSLAVASLILGLFGLLAWVIPFIGVPAAIAGLVTGAIRRVEEPRDSLAMVGTVLSSLNILLLLCFLLYILAAARGLI